MIGPYRLRRVLGTGSFATVWLAFDDVLDREVAVKVLADNWSQDHDVRRRFLAEARVLLTVESPRIVRGFHIGETSAGQPYLVMAYADRGTIGDRIEQRRQEGRTFDARETIGIATEVASALVDVHASGHLHRDVKPSNVLIRSTGTERSIAGLATDETVVLGDFGLARGLDLSAITMVAGSPGYVAPEQAAGLTQLDRRADLYPLGRMMLEMLTGDAGGRATTMAGAAAERIDVATLLDAVDGGAEPSTQALVALIANLVERNPDRRPSSAEEVAAALLAIAGSAAVDDVSRRSPPFAPPLVSATAGAGPVLTSTQLSDSPPEAASQPANRRRTGVVVATAVLVTAAIAGLIIALTRDGGGRASGTTTSSPLVAPVSSPPATDSTVEGVDVAETNVGETSVAGTDVAGTDVAGTKSLPSPITDAPPTESSGTPESTLSTNRLVLPRGGFTPEMLDSAPPNPDRQEGVIWMAADEFADALGAANPDWSGEPPEPNADGTLDFEMSRSGRVASIHIEPAAPTSGAVIVAFTIDYV